MSRQSRAEFFKKGQSSKENKELHKDTISSNSMDPNVWGPPFWDLLFTCCFNCPTSCQTDLIHLFWLIEYIMPCSHCRRSYAMYRKDLKPSSIITKDNQISASQWLWTMHDMVNQKLGKICISFEKLKKRHNSYQCVTSDHIIVDLLAIISISASESRRGKVKDTIEVLGRLLAHCGPCLKIHSYINDVLFTAENIVDDVYKLKCIVAKNNGLKEQSKENFLEQYKNAMA